MICSKCGAQNIDGVTFCGSCGATMKSPVPPPMPETPQQNPWNEGGSNQQPPPYGQQQQPPPYGQQQQSYGQQQPYNTGQSQIPYNGGMVMPKDYMTESIVVTVITLLCCCSPISVILGIIAIIKANSVKTEFERGDMNAAISNSESAKKLTMWAVIIAVIYIVLGFILYFAFLGAIIAEAGGLDSFLQY
jgi:Interferon-induced transmembrane protein.